jgi:putative tryptophan/tyrosine transport system substrate-binding protein
MTDRRAFIVGGVAAFAAPLVAAAQQPTKVWKVGHLGVSRPRHGQRSRSRAAFLQRMRQFGYVEGQNLVLEERYSDGDIERFPALAADLLRLNVDLIFSLGTPAAQAAKAQSATVPIVMVGGRNPVEGGLARSLARPGGTVTGLIQDVGHDLSIKALQLLKEAVPSSSRITILTSSQRENTEAIPLLRAAADRLGLTLDVVLVGSRADIDESFTAMSRNRVDAIQTLPSHPLLEYRERVVELATRHRIPAMYWFGLFVDLGGLMSYGIDWEDLYRRGADYVVKIFKGAKPADLPIEQPTKFELLINMKTAKALGLTIPPSLLVRADQLIE